MTMTKEQYAAYKERKIKEQFNGDEEAYRKWKLANSSGGGLNTPPHKRTFSRDRELAKRASQLGVKARRINVKKRNNQGVTIDVSTPASRKIEEQSQSY